MLSAQHGFKSETARARTIDFKKWLASISSIAVIQFTSFQRLIGLVQVAQVTPSSRNSPGPSPGTTSLKREREIPKRSEGGRPVAVVAVVAVVVIAGLTTSTLSQRSL